MNKYPVGKPVGEQTNEIKLKWLQHQIAERKQAIKAFQLEIENLTLIRLPQLEEMILQKEADIKALTGQQTEVGTIQA